MKYVDGSRRKFLSRAGSWAATLPLAAALPVAVEELASVPAVQAASAQDVRQPIPNRTLPTRTIGTASVTVSGLANDGVTDCTAAIQSAIDSLGASGGTVIIPWSNTAGTNQCWYMINPQANVIGTSPYYALLLKSNIRIQFRPGVKLQAMTINTNPSKLTKRAYMVYGYDISNVEICNGWFVGERYTHIYDGTSTDEWCHGIQLLGVSAVTIRATMVSDCTGDGICIGTYSGTAPSDVVLCDVVSTGNRRQALSITSGNAIFAYDSEFSYTIGTAPGDGIDIEPQGTDSVSDVTIDNCVIRGNSSDGIQMNANGTSITNVNIINCMICYNYYAGIATQTSSGGTIHTGTIIGNAVYQNGYYGISLGNLATTNFTIGGGGANGTNSNNFAGNGIHSGSVTYPAATQTNTSGYVVGNDIVLGSDEMPPGSGNVVMWNTYFTA
jgi:hypothetical protein